MKTRARLLARTRGTKKRKESATANGGEEKWALTLRRDWVEQETASHCGDKKSGREKEDREREGEKGEREDSG